MRQSQVEVVLLLLIAAVVIRDGMLIVNNYRAKLGAEEGGGYLVILGLLLSFLAIAYWLQSRSQVTMPEVDWRTEKGIHWVPIGFAVLAGYILALGYLGYLLSTMLFFVVYLRVFGSYRWIPVLVGSFAISIVSAYFWETLGVVLPDGLLP